MDKKPSKSDISVNNDFLCQDCGKTYTADNLLLEIRRAIRRENHYCPDCTWKGERIIDD